MQRVVTASIMPCSRRCFRLRATRKPSIRAAWAAALEDARPPRSAIWKQWQRGPLRFAELRKRGVGKDRAAQTAGSAHGPCKLADSPALRIALPNAYFDGLGIPGWTTAGELNPPNRRMQTRMSGAVTASAGHRLLMSIRVTGWQPSGKSSFPVIC